MIMVWITMENDYGMDYYGNGLLAKLLWNKWNYNDSGKIIIELLYLILNKEV